MAVWGFNKNYVSGISILSLPVEEVLFFFCIPYACLFTYFALGQLFDHDPFYAYQEIISSILIVLALIIGVYYIDRWYTGTTFFSLAIFLAFQMLKLRPNYMGRFYLSFLVLLVPFFIINGILTGSFIDEPVVWYNSDEIMGLRIGTIPAEDFFYALLLIVLSVTIAESLETTASKKKNSPVRAMENNGN
jgi:lycopene cyclase domain-containing protein